MVHDRQKALDRLLRFVEKQGDHWIWKGSRDGSRHYGKTTLDGTRCSAHRASWVLHNGQVPPGLEICHNLDCPFSLCVNPAHLHPGTHQQNIEERDYLRWSQGKYTGTRLGPEAVGRVLESDGSSRELAVALGVGVRTIERIRERDRKQISSREQWKWLKK